MKKQHIFLVVGGRAAGVPGSNIYCDNIYKTLCDSGHYVTLFNFEKELAEAGITKQSIIPQFLSEKIIHKFKQVNEKNKVDLFLSFLNKNTIIPESLQVITNETLTVNYTTNYHQFHLVAEVAKYVSLSTYISLPAKQAFDDIGVKSYWMPMAANPTLYKPSEIKNTYASFVGTPYGIRPYYMWRVLQHGIDLYIYGPGWKPRSKWERFKRDYFEPLLYIKGGHEEKLSFINRNERRVIIEKINKDFPVRVGNALSDKEMLYALASSHIVVNMPESRYDHSYLNPNVLRGCNFRDFEVPMSGSCLFTQYSDELQYFYEAGKEVVVFHNEHELIDQLKFFNNQPQALEKISRAGYHKAISEHTWERRFEDLFSYLNL